MSDLECTVSPRVCFTAVVTVQYGDRDGRGHLGYYKQSFSVDSASAVE